MKAEQFFGEVRRLPILPWNSLTRSRPFVVLTPHPDDESLGAGGLIALASARDRAASVALLTDGGGSHPKSRLFPRERLVRTRRAELEAACRRLGLSSSGLYALGFPDTAAPTCGSVFDLAVSTILGIVDQTQASTLFVTWAGDPHCDHRSAALLAAQARRLRPSLKLFAYPIWGWHLDAAEAVSEAPPRGFRIDISGVKDIKRAAIAAHASQMTDMIPDDPDGFQLTEEVLAPFLGDYEYFLEVPDVG